MRYIDRAWKQFYNSDVANNSEHSFRVAWIALVLAKMESVKKHDKILKMALLHDLPESRTGDAHYLQRQYIKRDEEKALRDMFSDTALYSEILNIFKEFEEQKTIQAKIVKDADMLDSALEIQEQSFQGGKLKDLWNKDRKSMVYPRLSTKSARRMWLMIHKSNPHDWHLLSPKNRFRGGDWKSSKNSKKARK